MSIMSRFLGTPWMARSPILFYRLGLGRLVGPGLLMLEHIGRKSGEPRRVVLEVTRREPDGSLVIASGFGEHSQWFKNLQHNSECRVWNGKKRAVPATAEVLGVDESNAILGEYKTSHPAMWERLRTAIGDITGGEPTFIQMVQLHLHA